MQPIYNSIANSLIRQIRRNDPAFNYTTWRPNRGEPGSGYGPRDISALQQFFRNTQEAGYCGIGSSLPRPNGVPRNWQVRPSKTGGGKRFVDPANSHNSVRIQPGNPSSPYPNSQNPYVRWNQGGQYRDANGNPGSRTSPDTHIPLNNFSWSPL